jgi:hypothetical protein
MPWEFLRDSGVITFVVGGFVLFGLSVIHRGTSQSPHAEWIRNGADFMMLGGACVAVIAMSMDYLLSDATTILLTTP